MNIIKFLKELISTKISDTEVEQHEWILCPKCQVNITKEDLQDNNMICPNCNTKISKE